MKFNAGSRSLQSSQPTRTGPTGRRLPRKHNWGLQNAAQRAGSINQLPCRPGKVLAPARSIPGCKSGRGILPTHALTGAVVVPKNPTLLMVVAVALIAPDGKVCLQQRPLGKAHGGLWEFPGGKIEAGESPEAALVREI